MQFPAEIPCDETEEASPFNRNGRTRAGGEGELSSGQLLTLFTQNCRRNALPWFRRAQSPRGLKTAER